MSFTKVAPGSNIPDIINVVIEIPAFSDPVKYEVDKYSGALTVDRFMGTAMQYPSNYGYIPQSLSEDGDPVDVMVITPAPLLSGCVVECRPIGVLQMTDEAGPDPKLLAVPVPELTPYYNHVNNYQDIQPDKLAKISHFFEHYKDLEEGKWVSLEGWAGVAAAKQEISESIARYEALIKKPAL
ncbi:inorganic diphosphatase [Methylomarinum sp. Ch1-1]|uniref:Inorganic pyrophosphatase n=1 Tax=Methylomarinum roseum TaxID=3067653 RepID=A0AAU7NYX8_9GAMM|nr:inorganic diphosphatase [Methylomarinum sp. Ch1-1]MDP4521647.1 inorganic diphosphatase [Methylomarinum sp. Ch1-1]